MDINKIDLNQLASDFKMDDIKWYDKEYFLWFIKSVVLCRDVKQTGIPFRKMYRNANNFMIVKNKDTAVNSYNVGNFEHWDCVPTHLINDGQKYYLCWTYE